MSDAGIWTFQLDCDDIIWNWLFGTVHWHPECSMLWSGLLLDLVYCGCCLQFHSSHTCSCCYATTGHSTSDGSKPWHQLVKLGIFRNIITIWPCNSNCYIKNSTGTSRLCGFIKRLSETLIIHSDITVPTATEIVKYPTKPTILSSPWRPLSNQWQYYHGKYPYMFMALIEDLTRISRYVGQLGNK